MAMAQARLSTTNRRREMECAVCLDRLCQPKMLSCAHNFCGECLHGLVQDKKISCPTCRKETTLGPGGLGDLPKNIALISIMASFCEQCLNRDQEVICDHCGLWMCLQCHDSCQREQAIARRCKVFMNDLDKQEVDIVAKRAQMTETVRSIMDQIDATEGRMIKNIRLAARRLREDVERELNEQLDVWDKLTTDINQLKTEISDFSKKDLKTRETSEIDVESLTGRWSGQLSSCKSEIAQANRLIEFIASETTPSLGEVVVNLNKEHTESTNPDQKEIQHVIMPDYEHAQLEYSTFGSQGSAPGQYCSPSCVASSPVTRNIVVLDSSNNRIQLLNERHEFVSEFGSTGCGNGQFSFGGCIAGLCVTNDGLIVVADASNHRLQVFTERGEHLRSIGSNGSGPGQFNYPRGLTVHDGVIYVCDYFNYRIQVVEVGGKFIHQFGSREVFGNNHPYDVTVHKSGDIYVTASTKLFVFTADGKSNGAVGMDPVTLKGALDVTTDNWGNIIVSDFNTHNIHILTVGGKLLRTLGSQGNEPGQLNGPTGVVCSQDGRIVVADRLNHRIQVFSVKPSQ